MNRRQFLFASALAAGRTALQVPTTGKLKLDIYGRHLLWLKSAEQVAAAAAEMGYDGVDINVRANGQGHVLPERVAQDLPPFVATIRKHGLAVSAITPSIADADTPYAEQVLRTASELGISHYWWGTFRYAPGRPIMQQLDELKPRVAKLAALNAKYKMTAMYHTYAGNAVGTPIWDFLYVLKDFDSAQVGFHYDVGHMTREGANGLWATNLRAAGRYVRGVSVKDFVWVKGGDGRWRTEWVPLGEGLVQLNEFASILKEINFSGPIENQPEYPDGVGGQTEITIPRERVFAALKKDQVVLRKTLAAAGLI
ncbi:MAG: sugar phosphate isomerase/epimerase [Acidobacteria bacterium]|nr:MAG: sugar phosphate isomerase/epimerase [Acidobacteriota bacterium]